MSNPQTSTASPSDYRGIVPIWKDISFRRRAQIKQAVVYLFLGIGLFIIVAPLLWMFNTAIRTETSMITRSPAILSLELTLENFRTLFQLTNFPTYFFNSVIVTSGTIVLTTVMSTLGGYGLARLDMPYKITFARGVLFGYMFPPILLAIPMYIFWDTLGIINSYVGLILAHTAISLPFALWLMWKFFQSIPYSLEESAQMAGATRFRAFIEVSLPMAKPGVVAVGIFAFAVSWGEFTMANVLMPDIDQYVLTQGLDAMLRQHEVIWGQLMAGSFIAIFPAFLFVYFLQKYLLRGFRAGGIG